MNELTYLEDLRKILQAAHDTAYTYPCRFTEGITTGMRIALDAVDDQIRMARNLEAAMADTNKPTAGGAGQNEGAAG